MNFRPELAAKVMVGEKSVTRRLTSDNPRSPWYAGGCSLKLGQSYAVCPGRGKNAIGRVVITDVAAVRLGRLTTQEAQWEGFKDGDEFEAAFTAINGSYDPDLLVWRIAFAVVPVEDYVLFEGYAETRAAA